MDIVSFRVERGSVNVGFEGVEMENRELVSEVAFDLAVI
jgi:hypothetical protein